MIRKMGCYDYDSEKQVSLRVKGELFKEEGTGTRFSVSFFLKKILQKIKKIDYFNKQKPLYKNTIILFLAFSF